MPAITKVPASCAAAACWFLSEPGSCHVLVLGSCLLTSAAAALGCFPFLGCLAAAACWSSSEPGGGRVLVLGSAGLLHDAWLDKEDNSRISDFVFRWLRPVSGCAERESSQHVAGTKTSSQSAPTPWRPDE